MVDSFARWRHYLHGAKTKVFTDNTSLRYLSTMPHPSARQVRWLQKLADYDFDVTHIPGKTNEAADVLSRLPNIFPDSSDKLLPATLHAMENVTTQTTQKLDCFLCPLRIDTTEWLQAYKEDPDLQPQYLTRDGDFVNPFNYHDTRL